MRKLRGCSSSVAVVDGPCRIEAHREGVAGLLAEGLHRFALLAARDGQEDELFAGEAVDDVFLHAGQLLAAGRAPRGPEVEQHDLSAQLVKRQLAAVGQFDREVGGRLPGPDERGRFGLRFGALLGRCGCRTRGAAG